MCAPAQSDAEGRRWDAATQEAEQHELDNSGAACHWGMAMASRHDQSAQTVIVRGLPKRGLLQEVRNVRRQDVRDFEERSRRKSHDDEQRRDCRQVAELSQTH